MKFKEAFIIFVVTAASAYALGIYIGWGKGCPDAPVVAAGTKELLISHNTTDSLQNVNEWLWWTMAMCWEDKFPVKFIGYDRLTDTWQFASAYPYILSDSIETLNAALDLRELRFDSIDPLPGAMHDSVFNPFNLPPGPSSPAPPFEPDPCAGMEAEWREIAEANQAAFIEAVEAFEVMVILHGGDTATQSFSDSLIADRNFRRLANYMAGNDYWLTVKHGSTVHGGRAFNMSEIKSVLLRPQQLKDGVK